MASFAWPRRQFASVHFPFLSLLYLTENTNRFWSNINPSFPHNVCRSESKGNNQHSVKRWRTVSGAGQKGQVGMTSGLNLETKRLVGMAKWSIPATKPLAEALRQGGSETLSLSNRSATRRRDLSLGTDLQCQLLFSQSSRCPNSVMPAPMKAEITLSPTLSWVGMRKCKKRGSSVP